MNLFFAEVLGIHRQLDYQSNVSYLDLLNSDSWSVDLDLAVDLYVRSFPEKRVNFLFRGEG